MVDGIKHRWTACVSAEVTGREMGQTGFSIHDQLELDGLLHWVAKAQTELSEPELLRAMLDVDYFPQNTPPGE